MSREVVPSESACRSAIAEVYGSADAHETFVHDVAAWTTVMDLDRVDVR